MSVINRAPVVHQNFLDFLDQLNITTHDCPADDEKIKPGIDLTWEEAQEIFVSQLYSRQIDLVAREMKEEGTGFYTIASAGHEGNAIISEAIDTTDPCLVHYRSGGFMLQRKFKDRGDRETYDILLSLAVSSEDPVSGGRHKIWGDKKTFVPPQTSTIASHLPRATGMAFALERMKRLNLELPVPGNAIIGCSFGDASVNHSVFQGGMNAALWAAHQNLPVPLLFICEDNNWGISVPTPENWIEKSIKSRHALTYFRCDGRDFLDVYETARQAVSTCRKKRCPVFLHMKTVRLMGHAGSDVELEYRDLAEVEKTESLDPLHKYAELFVKSGYLKPDEIKHLYENIGDRLREQAEKAAGSPKLSSASEVMEPLYQSRPEDVRKEAGTPPDSEHRREMHGQEETLPENREKDRHMAALLNWSLTDLLARYGDMTIFGEDVAEKGGVYYVTHDLKQKAGPARVFNTLLDETTILGLGLGMGIFGMLPFPEIQYLAYIFNAYDQLRGEGCSQSFFSNGDFQNGMVVRVQSFAYQEGFGGHFHNDNGIGALREIPGITIMAPSRGDDAVKMLRTAAAMARVEHRVVLFLEPIALYHKKHLYEKGDDKWTFPYPEPGEYLMPGDTGEYTFGSEPEVVILTYANGLYLTLRAARKAMKEQNISTRIVDLRWLKPLPFQKIEDVCRTHSRLLVVDEGRETGSPSEEIMTYLSKNQFDITSYRLAAEDSYVPTGPATDEILPTEEEIYNRILRIADQVDSGR